MSQLPLDSPESRSQIVLYQTEDGQNRIQVRLVDNTIWLTQAMMADLYQTSVPNINIHIRNVLKERELSPEATIKEYLIVRQEGSRQVQRPVSHEEALYWAHGQYDVFAERRRLEAEAAGEMRHLDDLRVTAETLETQRNQPVANKEEEKNNRKISK